MPDSRARRASQPAVGCVRIQRTLDDPASMRQHATTRHDYAVVAAAAAAAASALGHLRTETDVLAFAVRSMPSVLGRPDRAWYAVEPMDEQQMGSRTPSPASPHSPSSQRPAGDGRRTNLKPSAHDVCACRRPSQPPPWQGRRVNGGAILGAIDDRRRAGGKENAPVRDDTGACLQGPGEVESSS